MILVWYFVKNASLVALKTSTKATHNLVVSLSMILAVIDVWEVELAEKIFLL